MLTSGLFPERSRILILDTGKAEKRSLDELLGKWDNHAFSCMRSSKKDRFRVRFQEVPEKKESEDYGLEEDYFEAFSMDK